MEETIFVKCLNKYKIDKDFILKYPIIFNKLLINRKI
jgi:hypothetical protein